MTHVVVHMEKKFELAEIMFIDEIDHINEISNLDEIIHLPIMTYFYTFIRITTK